MPTDGRASLGAGLGDRGLATGVPHRGSAPGAVQPVLGGAAYAGATSRPIAHRKPAISRAMAATTTGSFLPALLSRGERAQRRICAFQAISRTALGSP